MDKREQEIMERLRKQTDEIEIPEGLRPKQMERLLEESSGKKEKRRRKFYRIGGCAAAACVAVLVGISVYVGNQGNLKSDLVPAKEKGFSEEQISENPQVVAAKDYEEVYEYLEEYRREMEQNSSADQGIMTLEEKAADQSNAAAEAESAETGTGMARLAGDAASYAGGDYSETNVRQAGVDEGDVVKTDGTYLYVLKDNCTEVSVVDTRKNHMEEIATVKLEDSEWIQELYVDARTKQMVLVCSVSDEGKEENGNLKSDRSAYWFAGNTEAVTYDISDPTKIKETGRVTQSGTYHSSRMADGYLYLFSNYSVPWEFMGDMEKGKPETYVPLVNGEVVAERDICMPMVPSGREYMLATAVDMKDPGEITDSKALLSQGGALYVSNENIYYYETRWSTGTGFVTTEEKTTIRRIAYKDGTLTPKSQGTISGYIHDSFSIDEYAGYLRVVTTKKDTNEVYVLNGELEVVGSIKGLAKEERVYSARFLGETGYFVTFKETDPLFSVDFSDPKNPVILGELKIPGFSDYLHPYGEGKLLGIGMNVDEKTMTADGVKLTLFDISDPTDVKEEATHVLENVYSTDVSYDYQAALVDAEKNIIGFAGYTEGGQEYFIFRYEEEQGFVCEMSEEINGNGSVAARGVFIDETLYVVQGNIIEAYSLTEYQKVDDIIL